MVANPNQDLGGFRRRTARRLREASTQAENLLWRRLRRYPVTGTHFRRQVPIGPYIVDFACMAARLIIEVDGSQHSRDDLRRRDEARTRWLESEGYRVMRFWNNDLANMDGVLVTIYAALYGSADAEAKPFKHRRYKRGVGLTLRDHPTPARSARRPSPSRGG
jgi:very-short-patch-repair endonuclease